MWYKSCDLYCILNTNFYRRKKRESKQKESAPFDEPPDLSRGKEDIDEENVMVEELPLPRMFIPGKIVS